LPLLRNARYNHAIIRQGAYYRLITPKNAGSGRDSGENYLKFFSEFEKNISIVDANHYDLEAIGVGLWAQRLQEAIPDVTCDMLYADHYISYSI
jgi:hypothetical protein